MLISAFISYLRAESGDDAKPMHNDFTGDGVTTLFQLTDFPVLEGSYVVQVAASQKTEGTDYTFDKQSGLITFAVAPANAAAIDVDFKYVQVTDTSWTRIISRVLADMKGEFFREVVDDDFEDTTADGLSVSAPTDCIDVVQWWYRTSDSSDWVLVGDRINWNYSKEANTLYLGRPFHGVYQTKLRYLKGYDLPSATTDTLDIQEDYEGVLQLGCLWKFYDYRLANRVNTDAKISQERTLTPLENLRNLSTHYYRLYLKEKGRKKPTKPGRLISNRLSAGGTP